MPGNLLDDLPAVGTRLSIQGKPYVVTHIKPFTNGGSEQHQLTLRRPLGTASYLVVVSADGTWSKVIPVENLRGPTMKAQIRASEEGGKFLWKYNPADSVWVKRANIPPGRESEKLAAAQAEDPNGMYQISTARPPVPGVASASVLRVLSKLSAERSIVDLAEDLSIRLTNELGEFGEEVAKQKFRAKRAGDERTRQMLDMLLTQVNQASDFCVKIGMGLGGGAANLHGQHAAKKIIDDLLR